MFKKGDKFVIAKPQPEFQVQYIPLSAKRKQTRRIDENTLYLDAYLGAMAALSHVKQADKLNSLMKKLGFPYEGYEFELISDGSLFYELEGRKYIVHDISAVRLVTPIDTIKQRLRNGK